LGGAVEGFASTAGRCAMLSIRGLWFFFVEIKLLEMGMN
jgi:hypothetical protein